MTSSVLVPIFPLDSVILVPGGMLPLHVFEPRYRTMVADALRGERLIAMALPLPGFSVTRAERPPVHPVVGLGRIVHHRPYEDGRSDIVLHGQRRVRILEEIASGRPYRIVRGEPLDDVYPEGVDLAARARGLLSRLAGLPDEDLARLEKLPAGRLIDAVLAPLPVPLQDKQRIHSRPEVAWRLEELEAQLDLLQGSRYRPALRSEDPRLN
jgi:Lon protease-like protein